MNHFVRQNGPFCDAEWPILKNKTIFLSFLLGFFVKSTAFVCVEWKKIHTRFFGKKCLQQAASTGYIKTGRHSWRHWSVKPYNLPKRCSKLVLSFVTIEKKEYFCTSVQMNTRTCASVRSSTRKKKWRRWNLTYRLHQRIQVNIVTPEWFSELSAHLF